MVEDIYASYLGRKGHESRRRSTILLVLRVTYHDSPHQKHELADIWVGSVLTVTTAAVSGHDRVLKLRQHRVNVL